MKKYFPFLRGKQNELMALRELSDRIAETDCVVPIIEPVNGNNSTHISIDKFEEASMPFLFICNPAYGEFALTPENLYTSLISNEMLESDIWTPTLQVTNGTHAGEISAFLDRYEDYEVAVVYYGLPAHDSAQLSLNNQQIVHHAFIGNRVEQSYIDTVPVDRRVRVVDHFHRQERNVDYAGTEFFSDRNTITGNPQGIDFGDFSITGDHFTLRGGPAYAVTIHHIHYQTGANGALAVSHFLSDHNDTIADPSGKVMEAIDHLVPALTNLFPNNTEACAEYMEIAQTQNSKGLGYLKRLAIKHHLEVMLDGGIQL